MDASRASSLAALLVAACGGGEAPAQTAHDVEIADEVAPERPGTSPPDSGWLASLPEDHVLTYAVTMVGSDEPVEVNMVVQQRVLRGGSVAVRLVPIGTPLGEEPVYPRWLIGTTDALIALDEAASFTTPGFVPIDDSGRLRTEAAGNEQWRVESRWLDPGPMAGGGEAALGWTFAERVGTVEEPLAAEDCVRLERTEDTTTSSLLACAGLGVIERVERDRDEVRTRWRLIRVGERSNGEID